MKILGLIMFWIPIGLLALFALAIVLYRTIQQPELGWIWFSLSAFFAVVITGRWFIDRY